MRVVQIMSTLIILSLYFQPAFCENRFLEAVRILEKLSEEGVDVSAHVQALNEALELHRANKTEEAEAVIEHALYQLKSAEQQLPAYRFQKWFRIGVTVAVLIMLPPTFYYFFPRIYALAWAYFKRGWTVKKVKKDGAGR